MRSSQGLGKCYQPQSPSSASTLIFPYITKISCNKCTGRLYYWLTDRPTDRPADWSIDRLITSFIYSFTDLFLLGWRTPFQTADWSIDWSIDNFIYLFIYWFIFVGVENTILFIFCFLMLLSRTNGCSPFQFVSKHQLSVIWHDFTGKKI